MAALALAVGCYRGSASSTSERHLQVSGSGFVTADHHPFQWRGITAFRLLDYVAHGKEADVERFLTWASQQRLTVVRVLAMGQGFMNLSPSEGREALPRLLQMAAQHGLHVEIVALAGTRDAAVNLDEHLAHVGRIAAGFGNALVEVANEPVHPSQSAEVQRPEVLARLRTAVPSSVPVALGSVEYGEGFAAGDYITWHVPRDDRLDGWGHVLALPKGPGWFDDGTDRSSAMSLSVRGRSISQGDATIHPRDFALPRWSHAWWVSAPHSITKEGCRRLFPQAASWSVFRRGTKGGSCFRPMLNRAAPSVGPARTGRPCLSFVRTKLSPFTRGNVAIPCGSSSSIRKKILRCGGGQAGSQATRDASTASGC